MSTFGLRFPTVAGDIVTSSETYNLHCLGQPTFFSTQRFQGYPASQYDNFYIASETAPVPFVVNRPGRYSTVLSVARSSTPGNWNIVILTGDAAPNDIAPIGGTDSGYWPAISDGTTARYSFSFVHEAPPTVLCFAKLPPSESASGTIGMALWDAAGGLAFDTGRKPLDPEYVTQADVPAPNILGGFGFYGVQGTKRWDPTGQAYSPGHIFIPASGGGNLAINIAWLYTTSATAIGSMPANPAFFFASDAECSTYDPKDRFVTTTGPGQTGTRLQQNCVPVAAISGSSVVVKWAPRAVVVTTYPHGTGQNPGWVRRVAPAPIMIIDADRYL